MFYKPTENGSEAALSLPGLALRAFEPAEAEAASLLRQARRLRLVRLCTSESPHLCYNHLTDYTFREEVPIEDIIAENGRLIGVLFVAEDVSRYAGREKLSRGFGAIMTDGRRFGKVCEYRMNSTAGFGSSGESEYALEERENCILVTAFMPFGGDGINPTELILSALPDRIGDFALEKLLLPVEFVAAPAIAASEIGRLSPAAVIMLGQAGGRSAITPEFYGKNLMDARIPDNAGFSPRGEQVIPDGAERLISTLPNDETVSAIRALGLPAELSEDAGAYVCNALMYSVLSLTEGAIPAGFIHVPFAPEQTEGVIGRENTPSMRLDDMVRGIEKAVETVVESIE